MNTPHAGAGTNGMQSYSNGGVVGAGYTKAKTSLLLFDGSRGSNLENSLLDGNLNVWDCTNGKCKNKTNHGVGKNKNLLLLCGIENTFYSISSVDNLIFWQIVKSFNHHEIYTK